MSNDQQDDEQPRWPFEHPSLNLTMDRMYFSMICPHCDREEDFEEEGTARAWLSGHIQEVHSDELPPFAGTGGNDE